MMRLLVIADDESFSKDFLPTGIDALIACGDLTDSIILETACLVGCSIVLAVKGNHDSGCDFPAPIVDLHLAVHQVKGVRFGGFRGSWKYKPRGHYLYEQDEVERFLSGFPPVDVFVAHNSPKLIHDRDDCVHVGFTAFNTYIRKQKPRLFLHGHQHQTVETWVGSTRVAGVYGVKCIEFPLAQDI